MTRALALAALLAALPASAEEVVPLLQSGPSANRIDLAILGDGYTADDQPQLEADARALLAELLAFPPYRDYAGLFNVSLVKVVSAERGADHGSYGEWRDTALGANFDCYGIPRLLCVDTAAALRTAARNLPGYDLALVLVNDPMYGGSGGQVPVISRDPAAADILRHELGHTFASLADEYPDPYPGYPPCDPLDDCPEPNATLHTTRPGLKWAPWLERSTRIPSPPGTPGVGLFEGCRYQASGLYRPTEQGCLMRALGSPFCPVCAEALVLSFWSRVHLVDATGPASPVSLCSGPVTLSATPVPGLRTGWTLDGRDAPGHDCDAGTCLDLDPAALGPGPHQARLYARDPGPWVRSDPYGVSTEVVGWALDCDPDAGTPDAGPGEDAGVGPVDAGMGPPDAGVGSHDAGEPGPAAGGQSPAPRPGPHDILACQASSAAPGWAWLSIGLLARPRRLAGRRPITSFP